MSSGSSRLKLKPLAGRFELHRRDPEVRQHPVNGRDLPLVEHDVDLAVVGMHQLDAIRPRCERCAGQRQHFRVAVDPEHPVRTSGQQGPRVPARTDRAIDDPPAARRVEHGNHFRFHDRRVRQRTVRGHRQIPSSDRACASASVNGSCSSRLTNRSLFQTAR